jgi:Zn-dependent M28 family amino/carboxypeptidase
MRRRSLRALGAMAILIVATVGAPAASAGPPSPATCAARNNNTIEKLLECVTLAGVREHQTAFQAIADANGGTRLAGTGGYEDSVDYVVERLEAAGYDVSLDPFPFLFFPPAILQQTAPVSATYETGAFTNTGVGNVTAAVTPVDINLVPPRASTSGCEAADFAAFPAGNIALIQRGTCTFAQKVQNAEAAGASAVIIFNQGNDPTREGLIIGTLAPFQASVPVVGASFADGSALSVAGSAAHVQVDAPAEITLNNVLAESQGGDPDRVVMAGAHLDSVAAGPGINDNGSGSAALIEVAEQMAKVKPRNKVRFAWWGAEEAGLVGSIDYVETRTAAELDQIKVYLNFDMVGSPNYVFFVYDGDDSDGVGAGPGPTGSAQIEQTFATYFASVGQPTKGTDFDGRSDYGPFIANGIPAGGLFTGAEGVKTPAEVAIWGGTAGIQYDPCYHLACDTLGNFNATALDVNSDAIAYATLRFAMNLSDIDGSKSKGNFKLDKNNPLGQPTE